MPFRDVNKEGSVKLYFYFSHKFTKISHFYTISNSFLKVSPDMISKYTNKYLGIGKIIPEAGIRKCCFNITIVLSWNILKVNTIRWSLVSGFWQVFRSEGTCIRDIGCSSPGQRQMSWSSNHAIYHWSTEVFFAKQ